MAPTARLLIETGELERELGDPALRILDCTVYLRPPDATAERAAWRSESGRADWERGHIPGSTFADLLDELSDPEARLPFTAPSAERFAGAMSRLGVEEGTRVVCYDNNLSMWATRAFWLLRAFGFDEAAVLNGGWRKWEGEGRPVSHEPASHPPGRFEARPRPERWATREEVLASVEGGGACIVNALTPGAHKGDHPSPYGRPGRIATSVNVSAQHLIDRETGAYVPLEEMARRFDEAGVKRDGRVITYCGGGIAATSDAFALTLLGYPDVAVYDNSLSEWARDAALPMEAG